MKRKNQEMDLWVIFLIMNFSEENFKSRLPTQLILNGIISLLPKE